MYGCAVLPSSGTDNDALDEIECDPARWDPHAEGERSAADDTNVYAVLGAFGYTLLELTHRDYDSLSAWTQGVVDRVFHVKKRD